MTLGGGWRRAGLTALVVLGSCWIVLRWASAGAEPLSPHPFFAQPGPWVIAHRGGAALRPENTLVAFEHARSLGVDVLELDVRRSRDGALVVIHDPTVDRTTDGHGAVAEMDLDALKRLDAGATFTGLEGERYGARIPTLEEVLRGFPLLRLNIEMKVDGLEATLCETLEVHDAGDRVLVASADDARMRRFRERCPRVATSATFDEALEFWGLASLGIAGHPPAPALQLPPSAGPLPVFSGPLQWAAASRGMVVQLFTIDDAEHMRVLLADGVHGIMTDRPDLMLRVLDRE